MLQREAKEAIERISKTFRVLMVTGPRQVGKTTLLKSCLPEEMNYVSLDQINLREFAQTDPAGFLAEHPWPLLIDEAQYAPQLFPYIKMKVDEEGARGMYWLTGSQQFSLMKGVQESLAGRVGIVELNSLTYSEITKNVDRKVPFDPEKIPTKTAPSMETLELFKVIFRGGMPELYDFPDLDRDDFMKSYLDTYVARDVKGVLDVRDLETFKVFMKVVASRNGEQLNYSSLANDTKISSKTAQAWMNVLVTSGLIYLLRPYYSSRLGRLTHMPKIIFMDQGLAAYLEGWSNADELRLSERAGAYLEAFVISELVKSYGARGRELDMSYYRNREKKEVDLVIERNKKIHLFEIKKTATPRLEMMKNFELFREDKQQKIGESGLICLYNERYQIGDKQWVLPVGEVINGTEQLPNSTKKGNPEP